MDILVCNLLESLDFLTEFVQFLLAALFDSLWGIFRQSLVFLKFLVEFFLKGFVFSLIFLVDFFKRSLCGFEFRHKGEYFLSVDSSDFHLSEEAHWGSHHDCE